MQIYVQLWKGSRTFEHNVYGVKHHVTYHLNMTTLCESKIQF
jgi:hypothetical protein